MRVWSICLRVDEGVVGWLDRWVVRWMANV